VATASIPAALQLEKAEQELQRRLALRHFSHFLPYWRFIDRETGEIRSFSVEVLRQWEGQSRLAAAMEEHTHIIALKAGKLGFTELECAYDAFRALGVQNARVHIFSRVGTAAEENLEKVRFGLKHLPPWLRPRILSGEAGGDTITSIKFLMGKDDVRSIISYTAAPDSSIESTAIHVHVDELARMAFPAKTWQAISSTVAPEGTCHIVSRGAGDDNYLAVLWEAACGGSSRYFPVFANWRERPGRSEEWLAAQSGEMTLQGLKFFAPETAEDALSAEDIMPFCPLELWNACKEELPSFEPAAYGGHGGEPVVIAVDAAVSGDCFAVVAVTRHPIRHLDPAVRAVRIWSPPGHGGKIDYAGPESFIRALVEGGCAAGHHQDPRFRREDCAACLQGILVRGYNIVEITYDPFQLEDMMQRINREMGVWCVPFDQGGTRLMADRMLYDLIVQRRLAHSGAEVLAEHMKNAAAKLQKGEDSKMRIVKRAQNKKVDAVVAMSMGVYEVLRLTL